MIFPSNAPADLLARLVAIPSVNPVYGGTGEAAVSDFVQQWLTARGISWSVQEASSGRFNVIARLGPAEQPAVALEAHMDTVGVEGWADGDPFILKEKGGRLYGRGACDTKASLACFMLVFDYFSQNPDRLGRSIALLASVDEESEQLGAFALAAEAKRWGIGAAISGEPTRNRVVSRHKGVGRYRVVFKGKAAHGSRPQDGDSAILKAARFILALEEDGNRLRHASGGDEMFCGTYNVGSIAGGIGFNVVPDRCELDVDRRLGVGESVEDAERALRELAADLSGTVITELARPPLRGNDSASLVASLLEAARKAGHASAEINAPYMTDAVAYEAQGLPSVVFGPGDIAQAHKVDEYIEVGEMERCIEILVAFFSR